jgi:hypothetical protein
MVVAGDVVVPTRSGSILLVEGDCPTKGGTNAEDLSSYVHGVASPTGRENKRPVELRQPFSQQRIPVGDNPGTPMRSNKLTHGYQRRYWRKQNEIRPKAFCDTQ